MTSLDYVSKSSIPNLSAGQAIITGVSFDLPVVVKIDKLQKDEAPNSSDSELLKMWKVVSEPFLILKKNLLHSEKSIKFRRVRK